jgi:hypothetical protein
MSYDWNQPIGTLGDIPCVREPIPVLALGFSASIQRGNDSLLTLVLAPQPGAVSALMARVGNEHKLPYASLVVGGKTYGLRNVVLQSVTFGAKVQLFFDSTPELKRLIALANSGIFDRYGQARPWGASGGISDRDRRDGVTVPSGPGPASRRPLAQ